MFNRKPNNRAQHGPDTSLIAHGTIIRGDVRFTGMLCLDGSVEGAVIGEGAHAVFTLSEHGCVQGEVRAPHVIINGQVAGDIYASERLELATQARVTGDVRYTSLEMAPGAQVNGRMTYQGGNEHAQRELPSPEVRVEPVTA